MEAAPLSSRAQELLRQTVGFCIDDDNCGDLQLDTVNFRQLQLLPQEFSWLKRHTRIEGGLKCDVPMMTVLCAICRHVVAESRSQSSKVKETSPLVRPAITPVYNRITRNFTNIH
jgi:hypothetical protein